MVSMKRKLCLCFAALFLTFAFLSPAHADLIKGYFEGSLIGLLSEFDENGELVDVRDIGTEGARFYFAYETSLAPEPECMHGTCTYFNSGIDTVDWLWAAFDFGAVKGAMIPGTATRQFVSVSNDRSDDGFGDFFAVFLQADWLTTIGLVKNDDITSVGAFVPTPVFGSLALPQAASTPVGGEPNGGRFGTGRYGVEFRYFSNFLQINRISEPGTLALFLVGLVGVGFSRRRLGC